MHNLRLALGLWMVGLVTSALPAPCVAADAEWPAWRGPNRDGKSADTGLLKEWPEGGPKLLWKVDSIGGGFSNVAVCDGTVYTTGDVDERLIIFACDTLGNLKWKTDADAAWT